MFIWHIHQAFVFTKSVRHRNVIDYCGSAGPRCKGNSLVASHSSDITVWNCSITLPLDRTGSQPKIISFFVGCSQFSNGRRKSHRCPRLRVVRKCELRRTLRVRRYGVRPLLVLESNAYAPLILLVFCTQQTSLKTQYCVGGGWFYKVARLPDSCLYVEQSISSFVRDNARHSFCVILVMKNKQNDVAIVPIERCLYRL